MKKLIIFFVLFGALLCLWSESPLTRQLEYGLKTTIKYKDKNLSFHDQLDKWFPKHQKLLFGYYYYLTVPYFNDIRADFYLEYTTDGKVTTIKADTIATYWENEIILKSNERIKATNLSEWDFISIKGRIAWLSVVFRTLGTPIPEMVFGEDDDIETWTVIYEDDVKERVILPTMKDTIKRLNAFYEGYEVYFQFNEVLKINSRLEFYGTFLLKNPKNSSVDFIDIRFHTDRYNEIDLIMLFIYRNIQEA